MNRTHTKCFALILGILICCVATRAQYDVSRSTGAPLTVYNGSEIDQVNMSSGNLSIQHSLLHLPGRGLDFDFALTYNSKMWRTAEYNDELFGYYILTEIDPDVPSSPAIGWSIGHPRMAKYTSSRTYCYTYPCDYIAHYLTWLSNDGTRLTLVDENGVVGPGQQITGYWSYDGTYVRADSMTGPLRYKDGVTVSGTTLKDTNGNKITCSQTSCTDTVGRVMNFAYGPSPNYLLQQLTYVDSSGNQQVLAFEYETRQLVYPWNPDERFNPTGYGSVPLLKRVILPNGRSYEFDYFLHADGSTTGEITKLKLPTGGYVRYVYGDTSDAAGWGQGRTIAQRIVSEDGTTVAERVWQYSIPVVVGTPPCTGTLVAQQTDPLGNLEVHTRPECAPFPTKIEYKTPTGTLLRTVDQSYVYDNSSYYDPGPTGTPFESNPRITLRTTTLNDTNQKSKEELTYGTHGNVTQKKEYDWGVGAPGALVRRTNYAYLHNSNTSYAAANVHILDRKASESVYTPSSVLKAQTLYEYDNTGITNTSGTPSPQHDYTSHPYTNTKRGNLTKVKRWKDPGGTFLTTTNTYNDVGNLLQTTDPGGHITSFNYTDNYTDGINRNSRTFVTQTTLPMTGTVNHIERSQYFFNSGLLAASCGENFLAASNCTNAYTPPQPDYTKYTYDLLNRLLSTTEADGGQTTLAYNEGSLPITATSTTKIDAAQNLVSTAIYDGLGRTKQTQQNSNPLCTVKADITYDEVGRQKTVTNPYCTTSDPTYGITTYNYDALGRTTGVVAPSGGPVTTSHSGNTTTLTDQQGKKRKSETDALGRLIRVWEPDATQNLVHLTRYQYDELDNLLCVHQKSTDATADKACTDATVPVAWRPRKFTYNSLSQMTQAVNPESGTVNYNAYNADGNLLTKTDARSITTTFTYDALHRLTAKTYSNGDPPNYFWYDTPLDGLGAQNTVGRLVKIEIRPVSVPTTASEYSYDSAGRVVTQWQCTPSNCGTNWFNSTYQFNFASQVTSQTNPLGFTLTHSYNAAAQLAQITSSWSDAQHPPSLVSSIGYNAAGAMTQMTYGNGLVETRAYNNRLEPTQMRGYDPGTGADKLNMTYGFTDAGGMNNGNVMSWSASGLQSFSRTYTYDELNRLKTMAWSGGPCNYTMNYDIWGNRTAQDATSGAGPCGEHFPTVLASNRIAELGYDAAGNVTSDGSTTFQYDAENRMVSINGGGSNPTYVYDANGRRVRKTVAGVTTDYVYDADGQVIAERQGTSWTKGYVYLGGQLLTQYDNVVNPINTFSVHKDHLGSTRLLTKVDKSLQECDDYYPFGELIPCGTSTTTETHKFTGKERDAESGLDYFIARYYTPFHGRFRSPDPQNAGAKAGDPQSWNAYAYARNNPLLFVDPSGKDYTVCIGNDRDGVELCWNLTDEQYNQFRKINPNLIQTPGGDLELKNPDGPNRKIGTATYYNEKVAEALIQAGQTADTGVTAAMIATSPNLAVALWAQITAFGGQSIYAWWTSLQGHHPVPQFLGGFFRQALSSIPQRLHGLFHDRLRQELVRRGFPSSMLSGGRAGSTLAWEEYMVANPGSQRVAFDAVLKVARSMDAKYATQLVKEFAQSIAKGNFTPYP